MLILAGSRQDLTSLKSATRRRLRQAFRPGTRINHMVQVKTYIAFCLYFDLDFINPSASTLCMYIEFLASSLASPASVSNYFSIIKLTHAALQHKCYALESLEVRLMLRAVRITTSHTPQPKLPITKDMLQVLCARCEKRGSWGPTIKCALLFGYYGFLRCSNLVPRVGEKFDCRRHPCRGDVFLQPPGIILLQKWSKTLQDHSKVQLISMPAIPNHPLCPVRAYQDMCISVPTSSANQPLLLLPTREGRPAPLSASRLQAFLKTLLLASGFDVHKYSLHSLRRGGATDSFRAGASYLHIQRHGGWKSDAFWEYITTSDPSSRNAVAVRLQNFMTS